MKPSTYPNFKTLSISELITFIGSTKKIGYDGTICFICWFWLIATDNYTLRSYFFAHIYRKKDFFSACIFPLNCVFHVKGICWGMLNFYKNQMLYFKGYFIKIFLFLVSKKSFVQLSVPLWCWSKNDAVTDGPIFAGKLIKLNYLLIIFCIK